jgi:outer membrane protein OmpA-like peptidoglycan-associated protein
VFADFADFTRSPSGRNDLVMSNLFRSALALGLLGLPRVAAADPLIIGEAPAALSISDPQSDLFGAGVMPALGVYLPTSDVLAFGVRLRAGVMADSATAPEPGMRAPDRGGLASLSVAARVGGRGAWIELAGGAGITGSDVVRTLEAGIGWTFDAGSFGIGPSLRYVDIGAQPSALGYGDARLVLIGVELSFGGRDKARPVRPAPRVDYEHVAIAADTDLVIDHEATCSAGDPTCAGRDRDGDGIFDRDDRCPDEPETVNGVDDRDGCADHGLFVVETGRIVLEERVLFDVNRARVKNAARPVIEAIAAAIAVHPEWTHLTIEGHADVRGPDRFNDWLSSTRADRVRAALIAAGVPEDKLSATGHGSRVPRDDGHSERAHQRNRRVEFVIATTTTKEVSP